MTTGHAISLRARMVTDRSQVLGHVQRSISFDGAAGLAAIAGRVVVAIRAATPHGAVRIAMLQRQVLR